MTKHRAIELSCPAKINLALSVGPPAPELGGLHPLASWMVGVGLADHLRVELMDGSISCYDIGFAADCPRSRPVDWPLEKDLCVRAHSLLQEHVGQALPLALTLRKSVPAGAGMGGGSSDAAHMLAAIDALFALHVPQETLVRLALRLGSDVPFFVGLARGQTSALITGLGEQMTPLPLPANLHLILIFPPFGTPTGQVYKTFDQLHPQAAPADAHRIRALAAQTPLSPAAPFNDLAEPACLVCPELRRIKDQLYALLDLPVHITGSGSTLFVLVPDAATAQALARQVTARTSLPALATWLL